MAQIRAWFSRLALEHVLLLSLLLLPLLCLGLPTPQDIGQGASLFDGSTMPSELLDVDTSETVTSDFDGLTLVPETPLMSQTRPISFANWAAPVPGGQLSYPNFRLRAEAALRSGLGAPPDPPTAAPEAEPPTTTFDILIYKMDHMKTMVTTMTANESRALQELAATLPAPTMGSSRVEYVDEVPLPRLPVFSQPSPSPIVESSPPSTFLPLMPPLSPTVQPVAVAPKLESRVEYVDEAEATRPARQPVSPLAAHQVDPFITSRRRPDIPPVAPVDVPASTTTEKAEMVTDDITTSDEPLHETNVDYGHPEDGEEEEVDTTAPGAQPAVPTDSPTTVAPGSRVEVLDESAATVAARPRESRLDNSDEAIATSEPPKPDTDPLLEDASDEPEPFDDFDDDDEGTATPTAIVPVTQATTRAPVSPTSTVASSSSATITSNITPGVVYEDEAPSTTLSTAKNETTSTPSGNVLILIKPASDSDHDHEHDEDEEDEEETPDVPASDRSTSSTTTTRAEDAMGNVSVFEGMIVTTTTTTTTRAPEEEEEDDEDNEEPASRPRPKDPSELDTNRQPKELHEVVERVKITNFTTVVVKDDSPFRPEDVPEKDMEEDEEPEEEPEEPEGPAVSAPAPKSPRPASVPASDINENENVINKKVVEASEVSEEDYANELPHGSAKSDNVGATASVTSHGFLVYLACVLLLYITFVALCLIGKYASLLSCRRKTKIKDSYDLC